MGRKRPNQQGSGKVREGRKRMGVSPVTLMWGQFFPMDSLLSPLPTSEPPVAYLLHGCPELALEVVCLHLDAHSCREQEGGGQGQMNVWEGRRQ